MRDRSVTPEMFFIQKIQEGAGSLARSYLDGDIAIEEVYSGFVEEFQEQLDEYTIATGGEVN